MRMPLRNAERNPLIEFIPVGIFWRRVHDADQLVFIASFFVEKRGRMFRIEAHPRLESVPVIREVILLLRQIGWKDFIAVGDRGAVVFVLFGGGTVSFAN